ncbi:Aste57867_20568 [Aphanomyces stellatus]|uniref:Aste57867_20568 protein n=1 Tax=Aphanomyces stellatus TaxID=120398 RepID=A0A485LHA0_9STRA|nr:hypothetical protein As57867_020501 [Aphanomyces stellatus]VFT97251.1 Aste57867_20568 [Aphanomyces stellatus]
MVPGGTKGANGTKECGAQPSPPNKDTTMGMTDSFGDAVTIYDEEKQTILSFLNYIREGPARWKGNTAPSRRKPHKSHEKRAALPPMPTCAAAAAALTLQHWEKRKYGGEHHHPASRTTSNDDGVLSDASSDIHGDVKKKPKKEKRYCVCDGDSHGDMIACDNKACRDRTNWYHMTCVGLDAPPDTWLCPRCTCANADDAPATAAAAVPENLYRKPALSITYGDMIATALRATKTGEGTFKEICEFIETRYESQLNWKLESDQRKSPVWKSSVRKILFSNNRFTRHPTLKGVFCLVPPPGSASLPTSVATAPTATS